MIAVGGRDDGALLLSQVSERLQSVVISPATVVLSVYDSLAMDGRAGLALGWRGAGTQGAASPLLLFAEGVVLGGTLEVDGGVVAAHLLLATDGQVPTLDAKGGRGRTPVAHPGQPPTRGGDGGNGGALDVYVEMVDPVLVGPRIDARGGEGGTGIAGGEGATGGAGGKVVLLVGHPALGWIDELRAAYQATDPGVKASRVAKVRAAVPDTAQYANVVMELADIPPQTASSAANEAIHNAALLLEGLVRAWRSGLLDVVQIAGGRGGSPNGEPGVMGSASLSVIGTPDAPRPAMSALLGVHPAQCAMLLERAKLQYLLADPISKPSQVTDVAILFDRIRARTQPFVDLADDSDLAQLYRAREASIGAVDAVSSLAATNAQASAYLAGLKRGLDAFGYTPDYVPLTSLEFMTEKAMGQVLAAFTRVETAYNLQFAQLGADKQVMNNVRAARRQIEGAQVAIGLDLPQLTASLDQSARIIKGYADVIPKNRARLDDAMNNFESARERMGDLNFWQQLLGAFSQLAFAPESGWMQVAQSAQVLYGATTTVTDIQGHQVNKDYLVRKFSAVQANIDALTEGVMVLDDGTLGEDDPGANKLLADEAKVLSMLDEFYGKCPHEAQELRDALEDYVTTVTARNNQVLAYNAAVTMLVRETSTQQQLRQRALQLNDTVLDRLSADTPDLTAFLSQAYYASRNEVLRYLDLIARAYRFWALTDEDIVLGALQGTVEPARIDSAVLASVQEHVWTTYTNAIGSVGARQVFPADPSAHRGETLTITGPQVDAFRGRSPLIVTIPAVRRSTKGGLFAHMAEVRVTHARVYLHGAALVGAGHINLTITHSGKETIVSRQDRVYSFGHVPRDSTFAYEPAGDQIYIDATFQVSNAGGARDDELALIGPFTTWAIQLNNREEVDLEGLTAIEIDFRGFQVPFA